MNRRGFLGRSGLLLGALGVAESFKVDLLDRLGSTLIPQANAAPLVPRRQIDICFRAGIPMMIFASGREFTSLSMPRYSNFSYAGNEIMKSQDVTNLYFNQDSQALMKHARNIAITQGVANDSGHTDMFDFREGGRGMGKTTPIVELANLNPTSSIVTGVKFPGAVRNMLAGQRDLVNLNNNGALRALYANPVLRMTKEEVQSVLSASEKLSRRQALLLENKMVASLEQSQAHGKASQMFNVDYSSLLTTTGLPTELTATGSYMATREALGLTLRAMQNNLINSSMVVFDLGDWHGYQSNKENAAIIRDISRIISLVVDFLKATPEPAMPSLKLWDTTTIVAGSEFTRGISKFNNDNNDGGTQGVMLIGKNIQGNYYGGFTLNDAGGGGNGMAHGFDRISGNVTMNARNSTEQLYQTVRKVSNLPLTATEDEKVLSCMLG